MTEVAPQSFNLPPLGALGEPYTPEDTIPISFAELTPEVAGEVLARRGFLIVDGVPEAAPDGDSSGTAICFMVAGRAGIDGSAAITPAQYAAGGGQAHHYASAANLISPSATPTHSTFDTTRAQEVHTDGTHETIGQIAHAVLYCRRPAVEGGNNRIYNLAAAYYHLADIDPEAAAALMEANAFGRYSPRREEHVTYDRCLDLAQTVELFLGIARTLQDLTHPIQPSVGGSKQWHI